MIEQLLQPFAQKRTSGNCQEESESFEELDVQMMKYGSLHQDDIEWERVEQLCRQILQNECKHFRVVVHLITCWLLKRGHQGALRQHASVGRASEQLLE